MDKIHIFWGTDDDFNYLTQDLSPVSFLIDIVDHISTKEVTIKGLEKKDSDNPLVVKNLIVHTDDYGGLAEWAILGFTNNVLRNLKVDIETLWLCNPPLQIYNDIRRNYDEAIISEKSTEYPALQFSSLKLMSEKFDDNVIGQPHVIKLALPTIYRLTNTNNRRPATLLFLGNSGIGKTETAKFISECIGGEMVRIQFSMQQTTSAHQYIFGSKHGEDSFARELIRRKSNVILLDEFDKVHPSFYNAFYQMFDEGKFVDANYEVDISKCIIICTSNYLSEDEAEKNLGSPIFSRFSKIIKFNEISLEDKLKIAELCYSNLVIKLKVTDEEFIKDDRIIKAFKNAIYQGKYPNMRMLKNDIEDAINCEILRKNGIAI